jgi:PIN domain nuclease of toxin-antitoxin system
VKYLLDTHTLLWALYEPARLPIGVSSILSGEGNKLLLSNVSTWEIIDKATKFRLPMAGSSPGQIVRDVQALQMQMLPIEYDDIIESVKRPQHHSDPLDRVLIAQARRYGATLLSKDGKFHLYDVPLLWN